MTTDGSDVPHSPLDGGGAVSPAAPYAPPLPGAGGRKPRRWRGWLGWLVALLVVAGLVWLATRYLGQGGASHRHGASGADAPTPVGIASVATGDMQVVLTGLGTVTPLATVTVQSQISGVLMSVGYQEGQIVRKGDFLAQIDPRPYQVALAQAQGALAHDSALLAQARSDLTRYVSLNRQDSIAKQQVTDQQFLVQQDQGLVAQDQASVQSAQLNLTYCHVTAPVAGRVGLRLVDPGNYVQAAGATALVVITQLQPISVVFVLPEDNIPDVAREMAAQGGLTVAAYDRTNSTALAQGALMAVDNTVDTTTGTVKLRARFANADSALFPNQFVNARLLLKTVAHATQAPVAAVQHGAPGSFVYLVKPDQTVAVQAVQTGITDGDLVQIVSGAKPGDQVVVDGADRLRDGARIRLPAPKSGEASSPAAAAPGPKHHRHSSGQ
jgi:multidrug efflux system membrane fusion protein